MTFFKYSLNLALLSLLTCAGLAAPALATADSDNSIRNAQFEGTVDRFGRSRQIKGDVTSTDDLADFRQFLLTGKASLRITGEGIAPNGGRTDLKLVRDFNNNGKVDSGEVIVRSSGSFSYSLATKNLLPGNYIVIIESRNLNANKIKYQVTIDPQ
ncbi:hypothetical protein [Chamaesiphon polymorphus]|uniref:DUF4783 domain-containing protein n=1 Tax=Chamaesiphon polymorphus CCALA 037 TaxID=2107692 RepID=A0A2T1GJ89_9CYAN|nr:hypothetical protein [Chamaesiphon polymorphus]PSB57819.1 hypothetical protein C7B77_06965 [Chamaesiphon polymorphus CCALA 037]